MHTSTIGPQHHSTTAPQHQLTEIIIGLFLFLFPVSIFATSPGTPPNIHTNLTKEHKARIQEKTEQLIQPPCGLPQGTKP